ncbi:FAD-dependent monooxygenase [Actibacterium ureilyticum]|uniref:FAD-dependent monooxygenase n=1 Tax=Actibacterium ureilyticum TaxID=1590614 RepID=UPI000BAB09AB|nr:FAD-dependent monooxygenase [Actibacterium ureilyticum]
MPFDYKPFPFVPPPGLNATEPQHQVIIVGAGPVGLATGLLLAQAGIKAVILEANNVVAMGSRALCWSKRSLEIFARLGIAEKVLAKGVFWETARTRRGTDELFTTDLNPDPGQRMPAFVNLQQYHVETLLIDRIRAEPAIDLRFSNRVEAVEQDDAGVHVYVTTPDGDYGLRADYLIACDSARSAIRTKLGLDMVGTAFEDQFLVADVETDHDLPSGRMFWFDAPFNPGRTSLLHRQPDGLWRVELQIPPDANPEEEALPEQILPKLSLIFPKSELRLDWVSLYRFQCRRLPQFRQGRVFFAGDSAHVMPPFGARAGNGGLQDAVNLSWRLASTIQGQGSAQLLDGYDRERGQATDENLRQAQATARFMAPGSAVERAFRDGLLAMSRNTGFARDWVNTGRLATPGIYPSAGPDDSALPAHTRPGAVAEDAPHGHGWLLDALGGELRLIAINSPVPDVPLPCIEADPNPTVRKHYLGDAARALYLIRPDQVIAARWVDPTPEAITDAVTELWEGRI